MSLTALALLPTLALLGAPTAATALVQDAGPPPIVPIADPPAIDTVVVIREDVFPGKEAEGRTVPRLLNRLHVVTRPGVIRREVLLEPGMAWDSARATETERNLRSRRLFREVEVDSAWVDGRLAAVVRTADAWSLLPRFEVQVASDGTLVGSLGATERNLGGTGNSLRAWYVRQSERDGAVLAADLPRLGRSPVAGSAAFQALSDRTAASAALGVPFRSMEDRLALSMSGELFNGRIFQYRVRGPGDRDTVQWTRRSATGRAAGTLAARASPSGYTRLGIFAEIRREERFPRPVDGSLVPDTLYGLVGTSVEWRRAEFRTVRHLNGFTPEDQDLSARAFLSLRLAPAVFGWQRDGVGVRASVGRGTAAGDLLFKGRLDATGLLDAGGLDSGRVIASGTAALLPAPRHATVLQTVAGLQRRPPPGGEFGLGFSEPPRLWEPHAFVGTRTLRVILEHRWYAPADLLDPIGVGLAAFADWGGAWYADQDSRLGGNLGVALLLGSPRSAVQQVVQLAAGWRFGGGLGGPEDPGGEPGQTAARPGRWAVSLVAGPTF